MTSQQVNGHQGSGCGHFEGTVYQDAAGIGARDEQKHPEHQQYFQTKFYTCKHKHTSLMIVDPNPR